MRLSTREIVLGWITLLVVLMAGSYWLGQARLEEWRAAAREKESLSQRIAVTERLINQRPRWEQRLQQLLAALPSYPPDKDVTAELLKKLERTAREQGLRLLRREPEKEKDLGDLFEVAIHCTWEADLEQLVHFLYAIQSQGAIFDVQKLTVTPAREGGRLKGTFTVDVAYRRAAGSARKKDKSKK